VLESIAGYVESATSVELGALVFGLAYVVLAARSNVWCWPAGIVASALSLLVAAHSNYRLDVVKEFYYVVMGIYGWYAWTHVDRQRDDRPITKFTQVQHLALIGTCAVLSAGIGALSERIGSSLPYLDASTTIFAFAATWLVARRILENWLYWIVINLAGIYMYSISGAYFFCLLLAVYTVVAVAGYRTWLGQYRQRRRDAPEPP